MSRWSLLLLHCELLLLLLLLFFGIVRKYPDQLRDVRGKSGDVSLSTKLPAFLPDNVQLPPAGKKCDIEVSSLKNFS